MRHRLIFLLILILGASQIGSFRAQGSTLRFDDWLVQAPTGWSARSLPNPEGTPPGLAFIAPSEQAVLTLLPSQTLNTNLRTWFEGRIARAHQSATVISLSPISMQRSPRGFEFMLQFAVLNDRGGSRRYLFYCVTEVAGRGQFMVYAAQDESSLKQYQQVFVEFLAQVDFVQNNPRLAAKATLWNSASGGIAGNTTTNKAASNAVPKPSSPKSGNMSAARAAESGVVYTIAQLSAITEIAKRRATGSARERRDAATAALRALGQIYVEGRVFNDSIMRYDGQMGKAEYRAQCVRMDPDFGDLRLKDRVIVVKTRVKRVSSTSIIELENCDVTDNPVGLKRSTLDARPGIQGGEWRTAPNQGLKAAQIEGVYLKLETGFGVGGMVMQEYNPYLFLKDGWVYDDPNEPPADFDVVASRRLEPKNWGRWQRNGGRISIRWNRTPGSVTTYNSKDFLRAIAGKPTSKLKGRYKSLSGGGNSAMGGGVTIAAWNNINFSSDGRFAQEKGAGSSGNGVTTNSSSALSGTYAIADHTIEFKYADGRTERMFYCVYPPDDGKNNAIIIGAITFSKR